MKKKLDSMFAKGVYSKKTLMKVNKLREKQDRFSDKAQKFLDKRNKLELKIHNLLHK